jgi:ABC-2 type transport system permease protein
MHVFGRALRDRQASLLWWAFGVSVYCGFIVAVWPVIDGNDDFNQLYEDMPDALMAMFGSGGLSDFTSPAGFLNTYLFSMILPFIFTGLAVSLGGSLIAGEEEDGLLDLTLSYPLTRRRLALEKIAAIVVALAGLGIATVILLAIAREPVDLDIGINGLAAATAGSVLFALLHGLVAMLAGTSRGTKAVANGVGWGVALAGYLANIIANIDESLDWLATFSPLHWATADSPVAGDVPTTYLALAAASLVLVSATVLVFDRHDLS